MKLLLENWRKYLKEEPVRDIELTPEQNRALKNIYLRIRELIENVSNWLKENNIDPTDRKSGGAIRRQYEAPPQFNKNGKKFYFDTSPYKEVFPNLAEDFYVEFTNLGEGENAELRRYKDTITDMRLNLRNFDDLRKVKMSVQHELQHFLDIGGEMGEGVEGTIDYLSGEGELRAHAKEAAYLFSKLFTGGEPFDIEEVKDKKKKFTNYYNFFKDPGGIVQRTGVDPAYEQKMRDTGEKFIKYASYFLSLFRRKQDETPT